MRDSQTMSSAFERACLIRLSHRELHRGQRPTRPHPKAGHMTATDPSNQSVQKHLDPQGPSTHDIVRWNHKRGGTHERGRGSSVLPRARMGEGYLFETNLSPIRVRWHTIEPSPAPNSGLPEFGTLKSAEVG
jgi:hypothetical protein